MKRSRIYLLSYFHQSKKRRKSALRTLNTYRRDILRDSLPSNIIHSLNTKTYFFDIITGDFFTVSEHIKRSTGI